MKNNKTVQLVMTALFMALIFVATAYLPKIYYTGGYIHIGDAVIYLAASFLPLPLAMCAAGVGGALADLLTGYAQWAPFTLVIKAVLALLFTSKRDTLLCKRNVWATLLAFPVTLGGYYIAEWILTGSYLVPIASLGFNAIQAGSSMVLYIIFAVFMDKAKLKKRFNWLQSK